MTQPIIPLYDRVLIKRDGVVTKLKSGLIVGDEKSLEKPQKGIVLAVGPGLTTADGVLHTLTLKPGDHVVFNKFAGADVEIDNETYMLIRETDILGRITQ